jgi:hypothetical protein
MWCRPDSTWTLNSAWIFKVKKKGEQWEHSRALWFFFFENSAQLAEILFSLSSSINTQSLRWL